ncbi:uncharacterized protein LOC122643810 [Telopea speciosissima]|uniref:uncharacterized protein LOC122643810 n=1 Tax=Telopea speciosissima TaxID=54955 RepID=UPI001CC5400C|nr:uncharacterized protein LOC122643810 [Telopea speciosissima]
MDSNSSYSHSKVPQFDGTGYDFWRIRMETYLKSLGYGVWMSVKNEYKIPTCDITDTVELKKYENDSKAKNALLSALVNTKFARVVGCETAKEVWDKLQNVHEGDEKIKEAKLQHYRSLFDNLKMSDEDTVESFISKVPAIEESKNLNELSLDELHGILTAYEMSMVNPKSTEKEVAFKAMKKLKIKQENDNEDSNDELIAYLATKFKNGKGKYKEKLSLKCFNCGGIRHFASKCPKKGKTVESDDEDSQASKNSFKKKKFILKKNDTLKKKSLMTKKDDTSSEELTEVEDSDDELMFMVLASNDHQEEEEKPDKDEELEAEDLETIFYTTLNELKIERKRSKMLELVEEGEKISYLKLTIEETQKMTEDISINLSLKVDEFTTVNDKGNEVSVQETEEEHDQASNGASMLDDLLSRQRPINDKSGLGYENESSSKGVKIKGNGTAHNPIRFVSEKRRGSRPMNFANKKIDEDGFTTIYYQRSKDYMKNIWQTQRFNGDCYGCNMYGHRVTECRRNAKPAIVKIKNKFAPLVDQNVECERDRFLNLDKVESGSVRFENNDGAKIEGKGTVNLDQGRIKSGRVLYVSWLKHNFLSVSQICDQGNEILFMKEGFEIRKTKNGKKVAHGSRTDENLYVLTENNDDNCMISQENEITLWHKRLGHINFKNLAKLSKNNGVKDLPKIKNLTNHVCGPCQKGKQTRAIYKLKEHNASKPLDLIHTDLRGPMRTQAIRGERYFMLLIDEYSRMTWVFFLKDKTEALHSLKVFKKRVENETGKTIKCIKSDQGKEFTWSAFTEFCNEHGI